MLIFFVVTLLCTTTVRFSTGVGAFVVTGEYTPTCLIFLYKGSPRMREGGKGVRTSVLSEVIVYYIYGHLYNGLPHMGVMFFSKIIIFVKVF